MLSSFSKRYWRRKKGKKAPAEGYEDRKTKEIIDQMIRMNAELQKILD